MRELGEYLKQMREARGLSLEEISRLTRIGISYIIALEDGDYTALPPDIYIRGFVKSYGEALGADIDELLSRYEAEKPKPKARRIFSGRPKEPPPYESPIKQNKGVGHKALIPRHVKLSRGFILLIVAVVIVAIVLIVRFAKQNGVSSTPITSVTDVVDSDSGKTADKRFAAEMTEEDIKQEIKLELGKINPAWALGRAESLTLAVVARQKTWVLVETDYRRAFKGDIKSNDTMQFTAKNAFFLTMGAPNSMHLLINGFDLAEWPERTYPMDLDINRGNVLQLLEGADQINLPRPPRPNIIGTPPEENVDSTLETPQIVTRQPGTNIVDTERGKLPNVDVPPPEGPPSQSDR